MTSADALAKILDLDVNDTPICLACLSAVVFAIDTDDVRKINGTLADGNSRRMSNSKSRCAGSKRLARPRSFLRRGFSALSPERLHA
jgi:hypothetical protein